MTTFSSQDFQQVFGTFNAVNLPPEQILVPLTLGSVTFGPKPSFEWPIIEPNTVPYEPIVTLSPAQQQQIDAAKQKLLEDLKKSDSAIKYDLGKADWSLMPWEAVEEINKVLEFGACKYAAHNWQQGAGFKYTRVLNSMLRHVFAYMRGEDCDPESGLSHMAHI